MSLKRKNSYLLLGFPETCEQAKEVAELVGIAYADIDIHRFPDGECKVTLPAELLTSHKHIIIYRSLDNPNEKLIELLLAAEGAKQLGVESLTLVAPYLAYMRQDKSFNSGEVVSQKIIGKILAESFNAVITVDSHLHRIKKLSEAIPTQHAINLTATEPMAQFLQEHVEEPLLIGPDEESRQWVEAIAVHYQMDFIIASKERRGDKNVIVTLPTSSSYQGRNIVLVDDMASSGQTLIQSARQLKHFQPKSLSVLVTHALFKNNSIEQLKNEGVANIWSCNSVSHTTNVVSLLAMLAKNLRKLLLADKHV